MKFYFYFLNHTSPALGSSCPSGTPQLEPCGPVLFPGKHSPSVWLRLGFSSATGLRIPAAIVWFPADLPTRSTSLRTGPEHRDPGLLFRSKSDRQPQMKPELRREAAKENTAEVPKCPGSKGTPAQASTRGITLTDRTASRNY